MGKQATRLDCGEMQMSDPLRIFEPGFGDDATAYYQQEARTLIDAWRDEWHLEPEPEMDDGNSKIYESLISHVAKALQIAATPPTSPSALCRASLSCRSGKGRAKVELQFSELRDAQAVHKWLANTRNAAATPSPETVAAKEGWTPEQFARLMPELSEEERARILAETAIGGEAQKCVNEPTLGADGRYCTHHDDDPAHSAYCYLPPCPKCGDSQALYGAETIGCGRCSWEANREDWVKRASCVFTAAPLPAAGDDEGENGARNGIEK